MKNKTTMFRQNVLKIQRSCMLIVTCSMLTCNAFAQLSKDNKNNFKKVDEQHPVVSVNGRDIDISSMLRHYDKDLYFIENKGQWPNDILYRVDFPLGQALATKKGMMVGTLDAEAVRKFNEQSDRREETVHSGGIWNEQPVGLKGHGWMMNFLNASPTMEVSNKTSHRDYFNYFIGNDASKYATNVMSYKEVWYNNVYANTDVRYYPSEHGTLEYDIICKPGSNPKDIAIQFEGLERIALNPEGSLILKTSVGDINLPVPYAYQKINGKEVRVECHYKITNNNVLSFVLSDYDATQPLIIDPIALRWATWITNNSTGANHGHGIWVDQITGEIYVMARVDGGGLITLNPFDNTANGGIDIIVGKYTEPTNIGEPGVRLWQTYIGGSADDNPYAMEQGPDGNIYMVGLTGSTNLPLIGGSAFNGSSLDQLAEEGNEAFVMKINQSGNSIKASAIGGSNSSGSITGDDGAYDLRFTPQGDIVVGGRTKSNNLSTLYPGKGATNTNGGDYDAFLFKINADLSAISWMKNFGGSGYDGANILLDNPINGDIFVGGSTASSSGIPLVNARQSTFAGSSCGFLQKLDQNGNTIWSSYFTSTSGDSTSILCMEFSLNHDRIYFGGLTEGLSAANISTSGVYDNGQNGALDFYICSMDTNQHFNAATYLGSSVDETNMMGMNVDQNNDVYVFGYTDGTGFPTAGNPLQPAKSTSSDKTFSKLSSDLSSLMYSTFYGGTDNDYDPVGERGIKFSNCRIYTIITSESNDIPLTQGALLTTKTSSGNVYEPGIVVWANPPDLLTNEIGPNQSICKGQIPSDLTGSVPSYTLPTISRNGATSAHPLVSLTTTYNWQYSYDSLNWVTIPGATGQNITGAQIGVVSQKTFLRRIINGDACLIAGSLSLITINVLNISGNITYATCSANIDMTVVGAVAPVTYLWSNGATTEDLTGVGNGIYSVTITGANGCSDTASFNVSKPTIVNANCSVLQNVDCFGNANGSAQVTASSGSLPYGYLWSNGSTTSIISGLTPGVYTATVTDDIGCTQTCSSFITSPSALNLQCNIINNPGCLGGSNGQLDVSVSGGTSGYNYLWSNGTTTSANNNLGAGTFTVTVTDANGCSNSCSSTIASFTPPESNITGSSEVCSGSSTQWCAPAGLSSYVWSTGTSTQCITVSVAGDYTVTVTDANGCSSSSSKTLNVNSLPSSTISGSASVCSGSSTQWCAPQGQFTYLWNTASSTQCITVNSAGNYTVTVTDGNGCSSSSSKTLVVNSLPVCSITGGNFCQGSSTQLCAATNSGYLWSTGATAQCIIVNAGGTYTCTVTNGSGCTSSCSKTVIAYTPPTCSITGDFFYCQGGSTQICAPAGLVYIWNTGAITQCITTTAGTYTVTVTDQNGCSSSCTALVTARPIPNCSITGSSSVCQGGSAQWCAATAPVGFTYSYLWSTAAITQCIVASTAGTYTVTTTDQYGCSSSCSKSFTVKQLPPCSITGGNFCFGSSTQLCSATNSAYLWSTGAITQCITVSTGGTYTCTVTSSNGCTSSCSKTVIAYTPPTCSITGDFFYCQGGSTQICAPAGLVYIWNTGAITQCITTTAGTYTVTVTDQNGCTSSCTALVTARTNPNCSITGSGSVCQGGSTQWCAATAPVGFTYSYLWSTAAITQCIVASTAGTYTVTTTDQYGCSSSCSKTLTVNALPSCGITGGNFCFGSSTQLCAATNSAYLWSTGAITQCITVSTGGTYTCTVTNANGCTSSCSKTVIAYTPPTCSITGDFFYCQGGSTQICAPAGLVYIWNTGAITQCITATAGTYTVTVTDQNGCSSSCTALVTARTNPNCSITGSGSVCQGGSAQWCAATAPIGFTYSYLWSTAAITQCIVASTAGTYTVTTTDQYGCSSSCSKTLNVNALPSCSITGGNFCFGSSTQLCAATNSAYLWSTGAITQCITVSTGGTYTCTVTNANGCTSSCSKTVIAYTLPSAAITGGGSVCNGSSTQWCAPSGLSSYLWSTGAITQCVTVASAGTYTVTVTDGNGCTSSSSKALTINSLPNCNITGNRIICTGSSTQLCGDAGFSSYLWSTGAITQCVTLNTSGTYTLTVTNSNGCTSSCSATISISSITNIVTSKNNVSCKGGNNGSSCVTSITGGTAPYSYLWNTGSITSCAQNLAAGTYTVTVTDNIGCTATKTVTIVAPTAVNASSVKTMVSCFGGSNGAIDLTAFGGTPAYSYLWNDGSVVEDRTGLVKGTYTVTITDANGCTRTLSNSITQPGQLSVSASPSAVSCNGGSNGSINVTTTSGTAPYSWLWSDGNISEDRTGLVKGTYTVTATDNNGCTVTASAVIGQPTVIQLSATSTNVSCNGSCNGSASVGASGGTPPYGYLWSNAKTTSAINSLCIGTFTVTVTDKNGCTKTASKVITQPQLIVISGVAVNVSCNGQSNGSVTITMAGGVTPYSFLWNNGSTTKNRFGLGVGTYTITVTDKNGCTKTKSFGITQPAVLNTVVVSSVAGGGLFNITQTVTGGTPAYSYLWSSGQTTKNLTNVPPGNYTVTVTDSHGCTVTGHVQPCLLVVDQDKVRNVQCNGANDGWIFLYPQNGTAPYTYTWSNGSNGFGISNLAPGTYTATVTDANGCYFTNKFTITEPDPIVINTTATDVSNCSVGGLDVAFTGGSPVFNVKVYNAANALVGNKNGASPLGFSPLPAGSYTVRVTDANTCTASGPATINTVACAPPQNITSQVLTSTSVQIIWGACSATGFTIRYNEAGTTNYQFLTVGNVTSAVLNNLTAGITYNFRIKTNCAPGVSSVLSGLNQFCINCAVKEIPDVTADEPSLQLVVTKNPVTDLLSFTVFFADQTGSSDIKIVDMLGQVVYNKTIAPQMIEAENHIDVMNLPSGIYMLTLRNGNGTATVKFVKQ